MKSQETLASISRNSSAGPLSIFSFGFGALATVVTFRMGWGDRSVSAAIGIMATAGAWSVTNLALERAKEKGREGADFDDMDLPFVGFTLVMVMLYLAKETKDWGAYRILYPITCVYAAGLALFGLVLSATRIFLMELPARWFKRICEIQG